MKTYELSPLPGPITAQVSVPGSKSYTNRALVLASLTRGAVTIESPLHSDDTEAMVDCLRSLGIRIDVCSDRIVVHTSIFDLSPTSVELFARDSGTTIRFLTALACIVPGTKRIAGSARLNERPLHELVHALRQIGAQIDSDHGNDQPPLTIGSSHLNPGTLHVRGDISSQFISALLMIAPAIGDLTIEVNGTSISHPYIEMTIAMMSEWGVSVSNDDFLHFSIAADQQYRMTSYRVEGDYSSAGYFFGLAALTKSAICVTNLNPRSKQADRRFLGILEQMGASIQYGNNDITVSGAGVKAVDVSMHECPDQAQTLAVLAAFAPGTTRLSGVASLRVKETERVEAVRTELHKMGIRTEADPDILIIHGGSPRAATIATYNDHRMAMSFSLAGAALAGVRISTPDVVKKTFPDYWNCLRQLGVGVTEL